MSVALKVIMSLPVYDSESITFSCIKQAITSMRSLPFGRLHFLELWNWVKEIVAKYLHKDEAMDTDASTVAVSPTAVNTSTCSTIEESGVPVYKSVDNTIQQELYTGTNVIQSTSEPIMHTSQFQSTAIDHPTTSNIIPQSTGTVFPTSTSTITIMPSDNLLQSLNISTGSSTCTVSTTTTISTVPSTAGSLQSSVESFDSVSQQQPIIQSTDTSLHSNIGIDQDMSMPSSAQPHSQSFGDITNRSSVDTTFHQLNIEQSQPIDSNTLHATISTNNIPEPNLLFSNAVTSQVIQSTTTSTVSEPSVIITDEPMPFVGDDKDQLASPTKITPEDEMMETTRTQEVFISDNEPAPPTTYKEVPLTEPDKSDDIQSRWNSNDPLIECLYGVAMCIVKFPAYFKPLYRLAYILNEMDQTEVNSH